MADQVQLEPGEVRALQVELNGLNVIDDADRKGRPSHLFWPWFGANVSVLGLSYGAFALGFGISFWQAVIAGLVGIVFSFLLCGLIALAGKRGSAPTMVLSRAAFGVRGNRLPSLISWLLTVGWETVLTDPRHPGDRDGVRPARLGRRRVDQGDRTGRRRPLIVGGGVLGFDLIMRMQTVITVVTGVLTVVYIVARRRPGQLEHGQRPAARLDPGGDRRAGLPDDRLRPRLGERGGRLLPLPAASASSRGVVGWTTFGSSIAPIVLLIFGLLLAGSSTDLRAAIAADPIGALAETLPTWFLVPFVDRGRPRTRRRRRPRHLLVRAGAARGRPARTALRRRAVDGVIMIAGTIYVVFFGDEFLGQFTGFLITLGVPVAAWCGIMLADIALPSPRLRRGRPVRPTGRYGDIRWLPIATLWWHRDRLGPGHQQSARAGSPGRATCSSRSGSAARRGLGRSPTWACCSPSSSPSRSQLVGRPADRRRSPGGESLMPCWRSSTCNGSSPNPRAAGRPPTSSGW